MANLTVWKFDQPDGASQALRTLKDLQDEGLIVISDAAIVEWPQGKKKPVDAPTSGPGRARGVARGVLGIALRHHLLLPVPEHRRRRSGWRSGRYPS